MKQYKFDVLIIGSGPAGVTAAGALAGTGISVALLEAGVYAGAENWSGCVYFTESLAAKDCFGPEAVDAAPFERRVVRRGTLLHNGLDEVGVAFTDPGAFRNCYTVLRPVYDPYFANLARAKGAVHITETTVTSLIRKDNGVVGVQTNRGPLYADVTFIAEGDASHLVRSEGLERRPDPHYVQGVKAVLNLPADEIEKRFGLGQGEGAAFEILIRNPSLAGRTAKLNIGGFLYTNRDSLSLGYVLPLENLNKNYRGDHSSLLEWMKSLPYISDLTKDATLSAYGTKIIRSGGWRDKPVLVEDGLVVGGASVGLGVDIPFPNFTGPASATGLYFARAIKRIFKIGGTTDAKNLTKEYLVPLRESVYGRNAQHLAQWPRYFGRSSVLFGRTADMVCGTAHFLSSGNLVETGRFLRKQLLSFRAIKESIADTIAAFSALRLWKPLFANLFNPATLGKWALNQFTAAPAADPRLKFILNISGKKVEGTSLPWPIGGLLKRISPSLSEALAIVYTNNEEPAKKKLAKAVRTVIRSLRLSDLIILPLYGLTLLLISFGTAVYDAFRFYILKTPVEKLLAEPVMAYNEAQRKARDLDAVKPAMSIEAKLATNTYRVGTTSHIRTLWPEELKTQPDLSQAGLWWVCPARVYVYDTPPFDGRGKVTVNFENCIKCESCWRAEPGRALWGRHTEHTLIYRPDSAAIPALLESLGKIPPESSLRKERIETLEEKLWYQSEDAIRSFRAAMNASTAFRDAVAKLPASANKARTAWPVALAKRLGDTLSKLEAALANDGRHGQARIIQAEKKDIELRLGEGRLFHALYCCQRLEQRIASWIDRDSATKFPSVIEKPDTGLSCDEVSALFPDRIVKEWEEEPMPEEWALKLRAFITEHRNTAIEAVRALSSVNPALGLIAAHQLTAARILTPSGIVFEPGVCAVSGEHLDIRESDDNLRIKGTLNLVPVAASRALLLVAGAKGFLVRFATPGITITPTPAIGFRSAGLSDVTLDCTVKKQMIAVTENNGVPDPVSYLAVALGAGDYLCKRVREHAVGRIQFPGQMLDTEGRDGIAKLGAVKALISRTEAWRLLLQTLYDTFLQSAIRNPQSEIDFGLLCATLSAVAFGPEPGAMGYDAGQVFGGFAYSEDDLLSRFYRDSSLFRFLAPGHGASARLHATLIAKDLNAALPVLGSLDSLRREPLGWLGSQLKDLSRTCTTLSPKADIDLAAEAMAIILGIRCLLVSIEQGLNEGKSMEAETAVAEVLLGLARDAVNKAELSTGRGSVSPTAVFPIGPVGTAVILDQDYETFCTAPGASHRSGSFLVTAFDRSARFVPEMQLHDKKLRARWAELAGWFKKNCSEKKFDGMHIERYIEKIHGLPNELLAVVKEKKWLATNIPESLDGLGWYKAEYYILTGAAGSFGDAGIDLLIMASTSIGSTPIMLGLEDEIPRLREELAPLARDEGRLGEIGTRLTNIIRALSNPNPAWIKKEYEAVMKLVDERIRRTRVVKYLAANFLRAFYGAGIAGRRGDFGTFMVNLKHAGELFANLMPDITAALDEIPRRERCHRLFLRYLGHGGVGAFALTEPTAGSDSGGVKTTAKLRRAKLTPEDDGRYSFSLVENDETSVRYLIDADKLVFTNAGISYQTPEGLAAIKYDKYDYSTDEGVRCYFYKGQERPFHDIGQVRKSDVGPVYEYYSLNGSKMWITNGSISTQLCLYAQTPEGVTGFLVDRHAEGLKVGADEKKTGQRGSPTNEIAIDSVRVPREAVIGYEGHGQVNALESLNVGRCGLAVVSGALMRKLMQEAVTDIPASPERDDLLGEAAAVLFGSESLAYYLIGLFDRPFESVRMESAIAKYLCSEDIHELITLVERAHGPEGQTEKFLLEKARRDSRILTIYEGTNEVQRFLILKDLISQAAAWPQLPEHREEGPARTLAEWKNRLRSRAKEAAKLLGDACWSDAMLQPALFPLAEMTGEILKLDCIYYRMDWLEARKTLLAQSSADYVPAMLAAGRRAADRSVLRLSHLLVKYEATWEQVKAGMDMPEVRAADAALDAMEIKHMALRPSPGVLNAPVRILSIVRPVADLSPSPRLTEGAIQELVWKIDPEDLAGLSQVLELKAESDSRVIVDVLMPGGPEHEPLLRNAAGALADSLHRPAIDPAAGPEEYVKTVRDLEVMQQYDLIITGADCLDGDQGLGAYLAGGLKRLHYRKERIEIKPDGTGLDHVALPAVIGITSAAPGPVMNMAEAVRSAFSEIRIIKPEHPVAIPGPSRFGLPTGVEAATKTITTVKEAAGYLKAYAASASAATAREYSGELSSMSALPNADAAWAMLDPQEQKSNLAILRACRLAADIFGREAHAVIAAPSGMWPQLLGLAQANGCAQAFCVDTGEDRLSNHGKRELVRAVMKTHAAPFIAAGKEWAGSFAYVAGETTSVQNSVRLLSGVIEIKKQEAGVLSCALPAYEGKLVRRENLAAAAAFITVAEQAEFPVPTAGKAFAAFVLGLAIDSEWLMPLRQVASPTLSQADVIINLGYGIKDRAGFALAEELRKKLEAMGLAPLFGATRKVTQDLKLLPLDAQIGQTGVRVNPRLIIALGVSGAPQHIDYISARAEILCFNKDADAPLMKLNQTRPSPKVHPIAGDLFVTIRELIRDLS